MIKCPWDQKTVPNGTVCPLCNRDLKPIIDIWCFPQLLFNEGLDLWKKGQKKDATDRLRSAVTLAPYFFDARIVLGKMLFSGEKIDEAIVCWQGALDMKQDNDKVKGYMSEALRAKSHYSKKHTYSPAAFTLTMLFSVGLIVLSLLYFDSWKRLTAIESDRSINKPNLSEVPPVISQKYDIKSEVSTINNSISVIKEENKNLKKTLADDSNRIAHLENTFMVLPEVFEPGNLKEFRNNIESTRSKIQALEKKIAKGGLFASSYKKEYDASVVMLNDLENQQRAETEKWQNIIKQMLLKSNIHEIQENVGEQR